MKTTLVIILLTATAALADGIETNYAAFGQLIVTQFVTAPFPHPARASGHTYHTNLYSAAEHYSDSTVAIFIPKGFRETGTNDFVIHFHGWNNTVAGTLSGYKLIEQLVASRKNAVLIVPEGPHNAPDSFGGKLEDTNGFRNFMAEVADTLRHGSVLKQTNFALGNIILSGHSGGYHVMSAILDHGGLAAHVREVWLFDALYGGTENFLAWADAGDLALLPAPSPRPSGERAGESGFESKITAPPLPDPLLHQVEEREKKRENNRALESAQIRLLDIYTDHGGTTNETLRLVKLLKDRGTPIITAEAQAVTPPELQTNHLIFLHTDMTHNDVVEKRKTFTEFLKTSCLQNL